MAKSSMNRPAPIFESVDIVDSEEKERPKYPPAVTIRKVSNGYIAVKTGGEMSGNHYMEDKEFVFKTAEDALESCGPFLASGKVKGY